MKTVIFNITMLNSKTLKTLQEFLLKERCELLGVSLYRLAQVKCRAYEEKKGIKDE